MAVRDQIHASSTMELVQQGAVELIQIKREEVTATISLLGGQLLSFTPNGEKPVLWHNPNADYSGTTAIRSGIPICWPWFNALTQNAEDVQQNFTGIETPSHGPVRSMVWSLDDVSEGPAYSEVCLSTRLAEKSLAISVIYRISDQLDIELVTLNQSSQKQSIALALHSYFAVSDIHQVSVDGLEGCEYENMLNGESLLQPGSVRFDQETDRLYQNTPHCLSLTDPEWGREIEICSQNSQSVVVWNPWIDKSQRLSQFLPDDYQRMVCIETARAGEDYVILAGGERMTLGLQLQSKPL